MKCIHLRARQFAKHSTMHFDHADPATTSYRWRGDIELCVFCVGRLAAFMWRNDMLDESPLE